MAYVCKICHLPVWVAYQNGVIEISIENGDKLRDVEKCPHCGNQLLTLIDLEFIQQEKNHEHQ
jgi:DNA-directed RNA polymerase subunit RPC12/RpoP